MTTEDLEILRNMMNGATPPPFAVKMLEDTCKRTNLDWKARHVYLQKRMNKNGTEAWQAVLSIDGFRVVGARHPQFAGQEGPFWSLVPPPDTVWYDNAPDGKPYSSKVGIRKKLDNGELTTTWGVAKYRDYAAGMMWDKFPSTMIAKCAEMLAWRKTFPETFGGLYGDAELQQSERTMTPKNSLSEVEIIGEAPVDKPEFSTRAEYTRKLEEAKSYQEVIDLGKEIQAAGRRHELEEMDVLQLHQLYTKMQNKYRSQKEKT